MSHSLTLKQVLRHLTRSTRLAGSRVLHWLVILSFVVPNFSVSAHAASLTAVKPKLEIRQIGEHLRAWERGEGPASLVSAEDRATLASGSANTSPATAFASTGVQQSPASSLLRPLADSTLLDDLEAYWTLDEADDERLDSVGSNDLQEAGTVASITGVVDNAAQASWGAWVVPNAYLYHADNTTLSTGDIDFTIAFWAKETAGNPAGNYSIARKYGEWIVYENSSNGTYHFAVTGSSSATTVNATPAIDDSNYHFVVAWHDAANNTANLQIDNGPVYSNAYSGGVVDSADYFYLGDGLRSALDEAGFWKRVLTADERATLYSGGSGCSYPFDDCPVQPACPAATALANCLVSYWKLDETSGSRLDSISGQTLSQAGTVTGASAVVNNGAQSSWGEWVAPDAFLYHADTPVLSVGETSFSLAFWAKETAGNPSGNYILMDKWGLDPFHEWRAYVNNQFGTVHFTAYSSDATTTEVSSTEDVRDGEFHFIVIWHDMVEETLNLQVDDGDVHSTAFSKDIRDGGGNFRIGAGLRSLFDEVGFWKRILSAGERTALYNEGEGCAYPFAECPVPALPASQAFATNECPFCNNSEKVYTTGRGINASSGNYNHQLTDGRVAGAGARLTFERSYNSLTSGANSAFPTYNDVLGYGWTHNYNLRLILPGDTGGETGIVKLVAPRGSLMQFADNGGTYTPFPGVLAHLTRTGSSGSYTYQVKTNSNFKYLFNNDRQLTSIVDPRDPSHPMTLSYTSGKLTQVQDSSGSRRLNFIYNGSGRLDHVDYVKVVSGSETIMATSSYTYDGSGNLDTATDLDGRGWNYVYATPSNHLLTGVIDPSGRTLVETTFDTSTGRATLQEDGNGKRITEILSYAGDEREIRTDSDDNDVVTTVTFSGGVPVSISDPNDNDSAITFIGQGINPGVVTDSNGNETILTWSAGGGNLTQVKDALGNTTDLGYDSLNNLTEVTDDLGRLTKYEYVSGTTLLERAIASYEDGTYETNEPENDLITEYTYTDGSTSEPIGLLRTQTDPLGIVTRYTYTPQGQQATVTVNHVDGTAGPGDEDLITSYTYDDRGRLLTTTDPLGRVTKQEYDSDGNLFRITRNFDSGQAQNYQNTYNLITEYTFDDAGRVLTATDTLGRTDWTCYDDAGRVVRTAQNATGDGSTAATDPCDTGNYEPGTEPDEDRITTTEYDGDGNVIATTGPDGVTTRTYYDDLNRPIATIQNLTDPVSTALGSVTAWSSANPDQNVRTDTVYDPAGNVVYTQDNAGRIHYNCYDALNRVVRTIQNPSAIPPTDDPCAAEYEPSANPDEDLIFETVYDEVDNVIATIEWGEATSASDPDRRITRTYYDAVNRPFLVVRNIALQPWDETEPPEAADFEELEDTDTDIATQTFYDKAGRVFKTLDLNTGRADWTCYDDAGRVVRIVQNATGDGGTAATDPCDTNNYDPSTDSDKDIITGYVYDVAGRQIATITHSATGAGQVVTRTYYDDADRRVAVTANLVYRDGGPPESIEDAIALTSPPAYDPGFPDENLTTSYVYDALGRVMTTTDSAGLVSHTCYDALGRSIRSTQNPNEGDPCSTYFIESSTPDEDIITQTVYDASGDVVATFDPAGTITRTYYDALHRTRVVIENLSGQSIEEPTPPAYIAPDGNMQQAMQYDAAGRVFETSDNSGMVTRTTYDALDRGTVVTLNYVESGPNDSETNLATQTVYDKWGNVIERMDAEGIVTRFDYDRVGRLVTVIENYDIPANMDHETHVTTHYTYDWHGNRLSIQDANAVLNEAADFTLFTYDALDRLLTETDPLEHTSTHTYTKAGTAAALLDAEAQETTYAYDGAQRLTGIDYVSGTQDVTFAYDAAGNRVEMTDSGSTTWAMDAVYRPTLISAGLGDVGYGYDKLGLRQSLTYPDDKEVIYAYDGLHRLTAVAAAGSGPWVVPGAAPEGRVGQWHFEEGTGTTTADSTGNGNTGTLEEGTGWGTGHTGTGAVFDGVDDYVTVPDSASLSVTGTGLTLEAWVKPESVSGGDVIIHKESQYSLQLSNGQLTYADSITWNYGALGYFGSVPEDEWSHVAVTFDGSFIRYYINGQEVESVARSGSLSDNGNPVCIGAYNCTEADFFEGGLDEVAVYDRALPAIEIELHALGLSSSPATYTYGDFGQVSGMTYPNGVATAYTYNDAHRLTSIEYETSSVTLSTFTYTLDKVGNRIAVTEAIRQPNNSVETVTIDYEYDPLYRLTLADYSDGRYFEYTYDAAGNRLTEEKCLVTSSCTPITTTYDYDIANRLVQVNSTTYTWDDNGNLLDDGPNTYTYDAANRLASFNDGTTTSTYSYNGLGDRLSQTVGATTTDYALDLNVGLTQVLGDGVNTYLYGNTRIGELQSGGWAYHLGDALGSVRQLVDAEADVTLARNFEPYGNNLASVGAGATVWQFTGEAYDSYVNLYNLRSRWLSTDLGRFTSKDKWRDYYRPQTLNGWSYVEANPINLVDPSGQRSTIPTLKEWTIAGGWDSNYHPDSLQLILDNSRHILAAAIRHKLIPSSLYEATPDGLQRLYALAAIVYQESCGF